MQKQEEKKNVSECGQKKTWEFDNEIHTFFVDFRTAYNIIHRESLPNIMKEFHFPQKSFNLTSISIIETLVRVQIKNTITESVVRNRYGVLKSRETFKYVGVEINKG